MLPKAIRNMNVRLGVIRATPHGAFSFLRPITLTACLISSLLLLGSGCATTPPAKTTAFKKNPHPAFTAAAERLKYPPSAGTGAYWGNGRFNVTLNNFYDEEKPGDTCMLEELTCFRVEAGRVYACAKGGFLVLDLASSTYKVQPAIGAFGPLDQEALKRLQVRVSGNTYFNPTTLTPTTYTSR